jgi:hypothetical protein
MRLLTSLALVKMLPCLADPGKIIVVGEADAALDGVLPLLNAILPNVVSYNPFAGVMTLRRRPGEFPPLADPSNALQRAALDALLAHLRGDAVPLQPD